MGYSIQWSIKNYYGGDDSGNCPFRAITHAAARARTARVAERRHHALRPALSDLRRYVAVVHIVVQGGSYVRHGGPPRQLRALGRQGRSINTKAVMAAPVTLGSNAQLSFWANYKIEEAWDFGFVQISTDGGATWTSLSNADTTSEYDPSALPEAVENLPGFTGSSNGWILEGFDLSAYAGQSVLIRFLYLTDWSYNEDGFYVDEIAIVDDSGTIFADDLEWSGDAWDFDGWLRTTGLAQNDWGLTFLNAQYPNGSSRAT